MVMTNLNPDIPLDCIFSYAHFQLDGWLLHFDFVTSQLYEFKWNSEFESKDIFKESIENVFPIRHSA